MYLVSRMKSFTNNSFARQIERLGATLQDADAVLIGAGAGLSAAAGTGGQGRPPLQTVSTKFRLSAIIKIACGVVKFQMAKL